MADDYDPAHASWVYAERKASAKVDQLTTENKRLRAALEPLAAIALWRDQYPDGPEIFPGTSTHLLGTITPAQVRAARNALKRENGT